MLQNSSKYLTLDEVLKKINDDTSLLSTVFKFASGSPLDKIFTYAFDPKFKWLLPETDPPFTPFRTVKDSDGNVVKHNMGDSEDLLVILNRNRLHNLVDKNVQDYYREKIFIQTLEHVTEPEAKILLAVKNQNLTKLFPNITRKLLEETGYLSPLTEEDLALIEKQKESEVEVEEEVKEEVVEEQVEKVEESKTTVQKKTKSTPKTTAKTTVKKTSIKEESEDTSSDSESKSEEVKATPAKTTAKSNKKSTKKSGTKTSSRSNSNKKTK